ncbi:hypothetical protein E6O75_ATG11732 [Venturia nashicola]|uniref:Uncharacterized protein n=1 Tax=Venturia nashicola TaxID=86259 RepID=A0A4Z1NZG8_9PEZI|nr:hypothetical protein E6O75_ATG11732 [Venturia nashicola]
MFTYPIGSVIEAWARGGKQLQRLSFGPTFLQTTYIHTSRCLHYSIRGAFQLRNKTPLAKAEKHPLAKSHVLPQERAGTIEETLQVTAMLHMDSLSNQICLESTKWRYWT